MYNGSSCYTLTILIPYNDFDIDEKNLKSIKNFMDLLNMTWLVEIKSIIGYIFDIIRSGILHFVMCSSDFFLQIAPSVQSR